MGMEKETKVRHSRSRTISFLPEILRHVRDCFRTRFSGTFSWLRLVLYGVGVGVGALHRSQNMWSFLLYIIS